MTLPSKMLLFTPHKAEPSSLSESLIGQLLTKGKKWSFRKRLERFSFLLRKKRGVSLEEVLYRAYQKYATKVTLRAVRVAGVTYQVPFELSVGRQRVVFLKRVKSHIRSGTESRLLASLESTISHVDTNIGVLHKELTSFYKKVENNLPYMQYKW